MITLLKTILQWAAFMYHYLICLIVELYYLKGLVNFTVDDDSL